VDAVQLRGQRDRSLDHPVPQGDREPELLRGADRYRDPPLLADHRREGGSTFRSSSSGFIFNWDTSTGVPTGKGCYTIVLQLSDGSAPKATTLRLK
jgi:hypothetical protein